MVLKEEIFKRCSRLRVDTELKAVKSTLSQTQLMLRMEHGDDRLHFAYEGDQAEKQFELCRERSSVVIAIAHTTLSSIRPASPYGSARFEVNEEPIRVASIASTEALALSGMTRYVMAMPQWKAWHAEWVSALAPYTRKRMPAIETWWEPEFHLLEKIDPGLCPILNALGKPDQEDSKEPVRPEIVRDFLHRYLGELCLAKGKTRATASQKKKHHNTEQQGIEP